MRAHALTEIGKSGASFEHTDRKLVFWGVGAKDIEKEKEKAYCRGRDALKFHNPAVSDTLD